MKQTGPSTFELGKVKFDKEKRTISFMGVLNMNAGMVEYAVVTVNGKTHESVIRTEAEPYHIQLAMLLLGAKGSGTNAFPEDPKAPIPGEKVTIQVSWKAENGTEKVCPMEDLVLNQQTHKKATRGPWVYNGSRVIQGTFIAQMDGSIVSIMTDSDALINNPREGHDNDKIWEVIPKGLPPLGTPMQVTIELEKAKKP